MDYFDFVTQQPGGKVPDSAELDDITTRDCPNVRNEVLKVFAAQAFAGTL